MILSSASYRTFHISIQYFTNWSAEFIPRGLAIGDSTIAPYFGQNSVASYITNMDSIAVAGETINEQLTRWNSYSDKSSLDYVVIQVGLNDVKHTNALSSITTQYQNLINAVTPYCDVYIACMIPAKQRWINLYGAINGATTQLNWVGLNNYIMSGATGVAGRINAHVALLDDGFGNLADIYQTVEMDEIHENNLAREIIANAWESIIF